MAMPSLAGIHFTGSTEVFQLMWSTVGENIKNYKVYPRIVGETGGKNFVFAHPSANVEALVANTIRGAFEYQGQKCSAASRAYIPESLWHAFKERFVAEVATIKSGDVTDFGNFMGAVIDKPAFDTITEYVDYAKDSSEAEFITGGGYDGSKGYFVEPTTVVTTNPHFKLIEEEIFGPVITIYVLSGRQVRGDARALRQDFTLRSHRRHLRRRSCGDRKSLPHATSERWEFLHQRQADGRGRGSTAVWRKPRLGNERQGRLRR